MDVSYILYVMGMYIGEFVADSSLADPDGMGWIQICSSCGQSLNAAGKTVHGNCA